ncbi:MAG: glycosyltransferase family 2 protein, partial [Bacteroidales bacterium]|nr:glycosyltransferase family 2 protein [Bacteroidales bacterium]
VKRFDQPNKGFGFARQCGLENAKGKYYIGADSDTIYPNGYVNKIIEAFEKNSSVVGVSVMHKIMAITFKEKLYYLFYDFFRNIYNRITSIKRPELVVRGFAFSHLTSLGREIGYRTDIRRGSDGAMAVSLKNYGKIKFLRKRRISPLSQSTLVGQDSMFSKLFNKIFFEFKRLKMYFTKREDYKDEDSNLMNNKKEGK